MLHLLDALPFPLLAVILLACVPIGIYFFFKEKKKNTGNPMIYVIPLLVAFFPAAILFFYRRTYDVTAAFSVFIDVYTIISALACTIAFIVTAYLAYKWGYVDTQRAEQNKGKLEVAIGMLIVSVILMIIIRFL